MAMKCLLLCDSCGKIINTGPTVAKARKTLLRGTYRRVGKRDLCDRCCVNNGYNPLREWRR